MPSAARVAVALLVVAVLLFASPSVVAPLVADDNPRSTMELGAHPLGETWGGDPVNETKDLVDTWNSEYVIDVQRYAALSARGSTDHLPCNRAVNGTVDLMRQATEEGSAETDDDDVAADLRCMADRYDYYQSPDDDQRGYRAFTVSTDADGETTTVETRPVNESELAGAIRERELVQYEELNETERRTVDRVLDNSTEEYGGYRPPADDPVVDQVPMLVEVDGEVYVVEVVGHVDDFNVAGLFVSLGLYAAGGLCLLGALVAGAVALYRRRGGGSGEKEGDAEDGDGRTRHF